ncbi:uncharacterized protein TNCV_462861 [Trichonephila clavipes]|nr:uncharacterized protein TNCV_462861 [Trichonephila clavipes]
MAQTSKCSYLGKLPHWPTDPLYHCRDFRYGPEHKKVDVTVYVVQNRLNLYNKFSVEFTLEINNGVKRISDVYGPNVMSSSKVRKWVRVKDCRENVHDEPRSGRPSVITDALVNAVDEKIREDRRFTISTLAALEFPNG